MVAKALLLLTGCLAGSGLAAQNLVMNGGFDEANICTEYNQACSPVGWKAASAMVTGYYRQFVKPYSGTHFLPLIVENIIDTSYRTYWQTRLLCPLRAGVTYTITFYAGSWGGRFYASNLGIAFPEEECWLPENRRIERLPDFQFRDDDASPVRKSAWLKVEAKYLARGGEDRLLIGNFLPDAQMTRHRPYSRSVIMYCIDDFSIKAESAQPCVDSQLVIAGLRADHDRHQYQAPPAPVPPPSNPPVPEPQIDSFVVTDVLFEFDSSSLKPENLPKVDSMARLVTAFPYDSVWVEGHTDNRGTPGYNLDLSFRRARTIASFLMRRGVDPRKITIKGYGEERPVGPNDSPAGQARNRRVVVRVLRRI